jgi:hypothetical protein
VPKVASVTLNAITGINTSSSEHCCVSRTRLEANLRHLVNWNTQTTIRASTSKRHGWNGCGHFGEERSLMRDERARQGRAMPRLCLLCLAGVGQPKDVGHHNFRDIIQFLSHLQL